MHLEGAGVDKDGRERSLAVLPPIRAHLQAEALLGQTLFSGRTAFNRSGRRPHVLTLAREAAIDSKKDKWIIDLL